MNDLILKYKFTDRAGRGAYDIYVDSYENTIERVKPYIQHLDSCRVSYRAGKRVKPCGCGLDSLLQAIGEQGAA